MTSSTRLRLLRAVAERGTTNNPHELQLASGTNTHAVVHLLYSLRDAGLVTFRLASSKAVPPYRRKPSRRNMSRIPTRIQATPAGVELTRSME